MPLKLEILTPEGVALRDDADAVVLPARGGEIEILAGHIPLITMIDAGAVGLVKAEKTVTTAVDRGYAIISADRVRVLTEAAENVENLTEDDIEKARTLALKAIEDAKKSRVDDAEIERLESVARFAIAKLLAKQKSRRP